MRKEAAARELVLAGRGNELRLEVTPFAEAVARYLEWCEGEYRAHSASARRIATSFASITPFFRKQAVSAVTAGDIEDYKAFRRSISEVREVTLRHDLHALSGFFQYAVRHNWCRSNPVEQVDIPSDKDAVRIHVLTAAEESRYFAAVKQLVSGVGLEGKGAAGNKAIAAERYQVLHDATRLILLQGVRPEEVMEARAENVAGDYWTVTDGKSTSARRKLRLTAEGRAILEGRKLVARGGWLFPGKFAGHVTTFQKLHDRALEQSKLSFVIYDLRHTFATRAAAAGMPVTTLAAVLGHSDLRCVMKYVHTQQADIDAGMRLLEAVEGRIERKKERRVM